MRITISLIFTLSLVLLLFWQPSAKGQSPYQTPKPKVTPTPTPIPEIRNTNQPARKQSRMPKPKPMSPSTPVLNVEKTNQNAIKNSNDQSVSEKAQKDNSNSESAPKDQLKRDELQHSEPDSTPTTTSTSTPISPPGASGSIQTFKFETIVLNSNGNKTEQLPKTNRHFIETIAKDRNRVIDLDMVEIPAGKFYIKPVGTKGHYVNVNSFWMSKYEITQAQWKAVMGANPSKFTIGDDNLPDDNLPVESISWDDVKRFLDKLNSLPNLWGRYYRLPFESEWEYAARANATPPTPFAFGYSVTLQIANYKCNYPGANLPNCGDRQKTMRVGSLKMANNFGLYDMHGNVAEWCKDTWSNTYDYDSNGSAREDDTTLRVVRGGSWDSLWTAIRSDSRTYFNQSKSDPTIGFRVVCARTD